MAKQTIEILFPDVSPDEANGLAESLAAELRTELTDEGGLIDPEVRRSNPEAQDFGTTLVLTLGTPAVIALANAVRDWAKRKDRTSLEINGVFVTDASSEDVADIVRAIKSTKS